MIHHCSTAAANRTVLPASISILTIVTIAVVNTNTTSLPTTTILVQRHVKPPLCPPVP